MFDGAQIDTFVNGILTGFGTATAGGLIYFVRWAINPTKDISIKVAIGKALVVAWFVSTATLFAAIVLVNNNIAEDDPALAYGVSLTWGVVTALAHLWTRVVLRARSPWDVKTAK